MNKPTDPYDPHHVTLALLTDLHSTNLQRQKEILQLRSDLRSMTLESSSQRRRGDDLQRRIRVALTYITESKHPKGAARTLQLVRQAIEEPGPGEDTQE